MNSADIAWDWPAVLSVILQATLVVSGLGLSYRFRRPLGTSPFFLIVGGLQFLHILFRRGAFDGADSWLGRPEGGIFVAATLYAVLLVHAKEGPVRARQLIVGVAIANVLIAVLLPLIGGPASSGSLVSGLASRLALTSLFGAVLLPLDIVLFIALYHVFSRVLPRSLLLRLIAATSIALLHDALLSTTVHHLGQPDFLGHLFTLYSDEVSGAFLLGCTASLLLRFSREKAVESELAAAEGRDPGDILTRRGRYESMGIGSTRDALTGLFNRAFFTEVLPLEMKRCGRIGLPTSLLILDIDFFKSINDRHGHPEGDRVLQAVAESLLGTLRAGDAPCRIGGEEFAVILPRASRDAGRQLATRIRDQLPDRLYDVEPPLADVPTVTIGIATHPEEASSAEELIKLADARLYDGKRGGRDCAVDGLGKFR